MFRYKTETIRKVGWIDRGQTNVEQKVKSAIPPTNPTSPALTPFRTFRSMDRAYPSTMLATGNEDGSSDDMLLIC
ncbi:hypothetical protein M378DRAFT_172773 [Amanita muscaria Koide BX008]|uniref:Uncharacterized protein n=1 Tax=Amanita muscaria (strain Koide BX008) TaxID=946122 RepID=A0A0C2W5H7_AMAMK|nr:hypothetical protein M378DRAFT_172773 [Amanita muscaria Koide BX008]